MKKILAIIGVFATIFALASCKQLTPEEADASREAARSIAVSKYEQQLVESLKHEEEIYEAKSKTVAELGKTEPGKKIVYKSNNEIWVSKYYAAYMDKDGNLDYIIQYNYYPTTKNYEFDVEKFKKNEDLDETNDELRLIVFRQEVEKGRGVSYDVFLADLELRGLEIIK